MIEDDEAPYTDEEDEEELAEDIKTLVEEMDVSD